MTCKPETCKMTTLQWYLAFFVWHRKKKVDNVFSLVVPADLIKKCELWAEWHNLAIIILFFSQLSSSPPTAASLCSHSPCLLIFLSCLKFPDVSHGTKMEQQLNRIGFNCVRKMAAELRGDMPPSNRPRASATGRDGTWCRWVCIPTFSSIFSFKSHDNANPYVCECVRKMYIYTVYIIDDILSRAFSS